jgi:hypothetical protein
MKMAFMIICVIITLFLTELSLQILHAYADSDIIRTTFLQRLARLTEPPFSWERYFLANYGMGSRGDMPNMTKGGLHQPHATRGWALRPDVTIEKGGKKYTTNHDGYRSLHEFRPDPSRYGVVIIGDSFTFGDGIDDMVTWPHLLQKRDRQLNVFNLAGTGYGIGQMYITLSEEIFRYRPKLVIAAFIDNDLHRSLLDFRDYKKPRFVINNNELVLTNTPIGSVEEVLGDISEGKLDYYSSVQIVNVFNRVLRKLGLIHYLSEPERSDTTGGCGYECTRLNGMLFEKMMEVAAQNDADFLMVYLPYGQEIVDNNFSSYGEYFFNNYKKQHNHFYLNPREEFLNATFSKSGGHYRETENRLLSSLVYKKIQELLSWKEFNMSAPQIAPTSGRLH